VVTVFVEAVPIFSEVPVIAPGFVIP